MLRTPARLLHCSNAVTQWRKMSTFKKFYTFLHGILPWTKDLRVKNVTHSILEQGPTDCCQFCWGEWKLGKPSRNAIFLRNLSKDQVLRLNSKFFQSGFTSYLAIVHLYNNRVKYPTGIFFHSLFETCKWFHP